jgi:hypothetical protein
MITSRVPMWEDSSVMLLNVGEEQMETLKEILLDVLEFEWRKYIDDYMWEKHLEKSKRQST